ncbi:MAG: diphthine synthase [Candidatus Methanomethylicia archaeon]
MGGKLYIVGAGLSSDLITLRGIKTLKNSDIIFMDSYTSMLCNSDLEDIIGRRIYKLRRVDLEERFEEVLFKPVLQGLNVSLIVPGNPLDATTHVSLIVEAYRRNIMFEIIPAPGIIPNALSMSGLMVYKIGKVTTLTYPKQGFLSDYPYDVIKDNDLRNLHTILLLEVDLENNIVMSISDAVDILLKLEEKRGEKIVNEERKAVAISGLGGSNQRICFNSLKKLKTLPKHRGPHTLVLTSPKLHFMEEEGLKALSTFNINAN